MDSTIFNDEDKRKRTLQNTADYFKNGPDYAAMAADKVKGFLGGDDENKGAMAEALKRKRGQAGG